MSSRRALRLALAALALAALAAVVVAGVVAARTGDDSGSAVLWVTRDRGERLLLATSVPAGQTVLQALRSRARVKTRYGGRFVQSVDGLAGDAAAQRDWFWFVNGVAGDRSAAEYRLREGDVAWWDYRRWAGDAELSVVAGAFPEPLLHGFGGRIRRVAIRYAAGVDAARVGRLAHRLGSTDVASLGEAAPADANVVVIRSGPPSLRVRQRRPGAGPIGAVVFEQTGWPGPSAYRHRFSLP